MLVTCHRLSSLARFMMRAVSSMTAQQQKQKSLRELHLKNASVSNLLQWKKHHLVALQDDKEQDKHQVILARSK